MNILDKQKYSVTFNLQIIFTETSWFSPFFCNDTGKMRRFRCWSGQESIDFYMIKFAKFSFVNILSIEEVSCIPTPDEFSPIKRVEKFWYCFHRSDSFGCCSTDVNQDPRSSDSHLREMISLLQSGKSTREILIIGLPCTICTIK